MKLLKKKKVNSTYFGSIPEIIDKLDGTIQLWKLQNDKPENIILSRIKNLFQKTIS